MPIIIDGRLSLEDHVLPVIEKNTNFIINKGILYHYAYAGMAAPVVEYYIQVQNLGNYGVHIHITSMEKEISISGNQSSIEYLGKYLLEHCRPFGKEVRIGLYPDNTDYVFKKKKKTFLDRFENWFFRIGDL